MDYSDHSSSGGGGGDDNGNNNEDNLVRSCRRRSRFGGIKKALKSSANSLSLMVPSPTSDLASSSSFLGQAYATQDDNDGDDTKRGGGDVAAHAHNVNNDNAASHPSSSPLPFHEIGSRMKSAMKKLRQQQDAGKAEEDLESIRKMSRKIRNSDPNIGSEKGVVVPNRRVTSRGYATSCCQLNVQHEEFRSYNSK